MAHQYGQGASLITGNYCRGPESELHSDKHRGPQTPSEGFLTLRLLSNTVKGMRPKLERKVFILSIAVHIVVEKQLININRGLNLWTKISVGKVFLLCLSVNILNFKGF